MGCHAVALTLVGADDDIDAVQVPVLVLVLVLVLVRVRVCAGVCTGDDQFICEWSGLDHKSILDMLKKGGIESDFALTGKINSLIREE